MELFQQLGAEIEDVWRANNYDEELLPSIAAEALKKAELPSKLTAWDVVERSLKQTELPPQRDVRGNFGDPPITIFSGPRFHIDVYFWFEGTTAIHQHGFCGAFQVLAGSSIHSWYEWKRHEAINTFFEIGDLTLKLCELLEVGGVQEIWAGNRYIHSLFHLDQPSATIVVRTDKSPLHLPQFSYHKPCIAIDPFFEQDTTTKKLQMMSTLFRAKRPDAESLATDFLKSSDMQTSYMILTQLRALLRSNQLGELFKLEGPKAQFDGFIRIIENRHRSAGTAMRSVFEWSDMVDEIVNRRSYVTNAEHRFFMALLLNVDTRERIFSLIKQRFSDADPVDKVLDWVFDLAETRVIGIEATNALGIPEFGETEMFVLENLLKDKTDAEIKTAYTRENPNSEAEALSQSIDKIRSAVIFRPLLA